MNPSPKMSWLRSLSFPRRLTLLYMAALGSIALLTILGQAVVQRSIQRLEGDSRIVNVSGRQRMLSQRLTRLALELELSNRTASHSEALERTEQQDAIRTDLKLWKEAHTALQVGSEDLPSARTNSPEVTRLFESLKPHFEDLKRTFASLVDDDTTPDSNSRKLDLAQLSLHSDAFVDGMDRIVSQLETEARGRVDRLRWIERALLLLTIAVLILEGLFVFSPAVASLGRTLQDLQKVTQQLEIAKQNAESANQAKTNFLARVSHELRTPLHVILGMLGLVNQGKLPASQRRKVQLASDASSSLRCLVDDLLDIASIELGREVSAQPRETDLPRLLQGSAEIFQPIASEKNLAFQIQIARNLPKKVWIDQDRVRQILTNLLQNALRYTQAGSVRFEADCHLNTTGDTGQLVVRMIDTGIGIATEKIPAMRVAKEQPKSETFGRSLGLGLSITRALIERLNGNLEVESEIGKGSVFTVRLPLEVRNEVLLSSSRPLASPDRTQLESAARQQEPIRKKKVLGTALVVDDSPSNRILLRSYLKRLGIRSISVGSLEETILRLKDHSFDFVFMDRNLPDGDGLSFLERMPAKANSTGMTKQSTWTFLVTADIHLRDRNDQGLDQLTGLLHKPVSFHELKQTLQSVLPSIEQSDYSIQLEPTMEDNAVRKDSDLNSYDSLRQKLAKLVLDQLPKDLGHLKKKSSEKDWKGIAFIAHRLRGSASNAGLEAIASLASELENAAEKQDETSVNDLLARAMQDS